MQNVSQFPGSHPKSNASNAQRKILGGPLYARATVIALLSRSGCLVAWTKECIKDLQKLELTADDAAGIVCEAIKTGRYRDSEWCIQSPGGPWAACDAYDVRRIEYNAYAKKDLPVDYFVKFAVSKTGQVVLLASCHP